MTTVIQIDRVSFGYGAQRPVLSQISVGVRQGAFLAVAGANGVGKSTLIKIMAGLLKPQSGTVLLEGRELYSYSVQEIARRIAVVRQEFVPAFGFSVLETVLMARTAGYGPLGFERKEDRALATRALEMTDTARFSSRPLGSLSAGERQRVFIARALAQNTPILLLDEPTSFLDLKHQVAIYDLLKSIQEETAATIVAVTHDLNLATQYCDEALLLYPPAEDSDAALGGSHPTSPSRCRIGSISEVLSPPEIQRAFGVHVFSGRIGQERFIMPLGTKAKDAGFSGRSA
ncbi:MAG: ABC transporter ATP-binding protein [Phycisphaerales bacterium]